MVGGGRVKNEGDLLVLKDAGLLSCSGWAEGADEKKEREELVKTWGEGVMI